MPLFLGRATDISTAGEAYYRVKLREVREEYEEIVKEERVLREWLEYLKFIVRWIDSKPQISGHVEGEEGYKFSELVANTILQNSAYKHFHEIYSRNEMMDKNELLYFMSLKNLLNVCKKNPSITLRELRDRVPEYEHEIELNMDEQHEVIGIIQFWKQMIRNIRRRHARA